jgi:hypothetical protein
VYAACRVVLRETSKEETMQTGQTVCKCDLKVLQGVPESKKKLFFFKY